MFLTNHSSAFLLHDVRVVKNVACLSSLITYKKRGLFKMVISKASRKLYLQVDKANKLKKISMNSTIKTKNRYA